MTKRDPTPKKPATGDLSPPPAGVLPDGDAVVSPGAGSPVLAGGAKVPWLGLLLALLVFGTFFPVLKNDFVNYDDHAYVTENTQVQRGLSWAGISWAFGSATASNWHPLTMLSHMLDWQLYRLHPWGHHLTSLLLHTANVVLLFLVLRRMTGALWRSLCVALLFGLHPLDVQSVAWVAERKNVLSTCFWLLTLWCYARYAQKTEVGSQRAEVRNQKPDVGSPTSDLRPPASGFYWLALICFALGLMSKPMLVTLPFVLLLLDYWPLKRVSHVPWQMTEWKKLVLEKIPFFFLSAAVCVVTFLVQKAGGGVPSLDRLSLAERLVNALVSYGRYLGKLFWPENFAVLYPYPRSWPIGVVLGSGVLLLGVSLAVVALRRSRPWLLVGWFWFVGTLVPVIGLVQTGEQSIADRHMYVPMIGLLILVVWGLHPLVLRRPSLRWLALAVTAAAAVSCLIITRREIGYWQDNETLFRHDIAIAGGTPTAYYQLGVSLNEKGRPEEAAANFQELLKLRPNDFHALYALGVIASNKKQLAEAIPLFQQVIALNPDYPEAHYSLGVALAQQGQLEAALNQYQEAVRLNPGYFAARMSLGTALGRSGRLPEAITQFQAAHQLKPADLGALYNLGTAFNGSGQLDDAILAFQEVLKLKPDHADAHNNLGLAFSRQGRLDEAISQFQEALRLNPSHARARSNLDAAMQAKNAPAAPAPNP